ncbi:hypothetical protein SAMN05421796_11060 [Chryseobacterium piscicola]|uniref:Uncharacterized protein n=1 Tax=Chryseobacterium piscicola TaxID=551459 RepID=A0A1N7P152_9FLAO|nr:hypothetical protein [Chryseobacterium piscicola]PQA92756.1 hypothetical protein B0A70_10245 [Chryseobacterium piscicola]SIT04291.1 hypothetical protein SAMN05421796_11060 [Chryseobacterium piscicola]
MSDAQQKLETARNIYQSLPLEKQLEIKKQQPDLYHAIYGDDVIPNTYYLEPFIENNKTGLEGEIPKESQNANLSAEIVKGFKNAKFSKVPASIVEANDLFQKLSIDTQMRIKKDKPEIYNMLFKENVFVDTSALSAFLKDYDPKYLEIKSIRDLETLSLSAQLEFKNNFPGEYASFMKIN